METWLPVVDWEGLYEVSDVGRARTVPRIVDIYGGRKRLVSETILKAHPFGNCGYLGVVLSGNGRRQSYAVHRLVALAFLGPRPQGMTINHKDGNKLNNTSVNLEYCSVGDNNRHALRTGLRVNPKGSCNGASKLVDGQVVEIKKRLRHGDKQRTVAADYGVSVSLISLIGLGRVWGHVS